MPSAQNISYPTEHMRQVAQRIATGSDDLQQLTDKLWSQIDHALTDLPMPIKTVLEIVIEILKKDLNHLLNERSELSRNLARVADLAAQVDHGTSTGFAAPNATGNEIKGGA